MHRPQLCVRPRPPPPIPPQEHTRSRRKTCSDHIKELNNQRPKQPFFFLKPPSSILLPGEGPLLRPRGVTMHYEVELGLVIGKTLRDLHPEDEKGALDSIEGRILYIFNFCVSVCVEGSYVLQCSRNYFPSNCCTSLQ